MKESFFKKKRKEKRTNLPFSIWVQTETFNCPCINLFNEKNRKQLDDGSYGCGIFVDFQKIFDTKDHNVLLKKARTVWH